MLVPGKGSRTRSVPMPAWAKVVIDVTIRSLPAVPYRNALCTLPLLKDRAAHDEHEYVRQAAVQELARGWKDDPNTRNLVSGAAAKSNEG